MRILADTNLSEPTVAALRNAGHDVVWMYEDDRWMVDPSILAFAVRENRLLITFDTDFGELTFRERLPASCGVVLFRIAEAVTVLETAHLIVHNLAAPIGWADRFWVINIRKRALPTG
jgi:predicted nuclease of predicted toxin-antitoxin system